MISRLLTAIDRVRPPVHASAHCDLPCGVYDPAQARIEAESVKGIQEKYQGSDDPVFKQRAV
ncbi:MAG: superoxide dismutase, Ni, partial [Actinobacteria bacterium]|nr:superoxide dismutase, Ni [Actinomycetota bacterium]